MDDILELIELKTKKYKYLNWLSILLSIVLTLAGTVSVVYLLMFLHDTLGLHLFLCFLLSVAFPQLYSAVVNAVIFDGIDNKAKQLLLEISELEKEYELMRCSEKDIEIQSVELRFDGLSVGNKLKLLNYVKDNLPLDEPDRTSSLLTDEELSSILEDGVKDRTSEMAGYSRRRVISEEMDNKF